MLQMLDAILASTDDKQKFFERIARLFGQGSPEYKKVERAYNDAKTGFRGKYREELHKPYFEHLRISTIILIDILRVDDADRICAELLHDNVEDLPEWTVERVKKEYGERVAYLVARLTKPKFDPSISRDERRERYHAQIASSSREVIENKLAELEHNALTLQFCPSEKQHRKVREIREFYLPLARKYGILFAELEEAVLRVEHVWRSSEYEKCMGGVAA